MNRIDQLFQQRSEPVLNIYFTAGFPQLNDTRTILKSLQEAGADLIEIGIPYSDPVADGPTIQGSNKIALDNGMSLRRLMEQLKGLRSEIKVPVVLMGYVNPIVQYGIEAFCRDCEEVGIDGLILPDLPMYEYLNFYKPTFEKHGLHNIFLISPQTSEARIREIDEYSRGFIYMVSSAAVTGAKQGISQEQVAYFERVEKMQLRHPRLIGFGISDRESFLKASQYADGAIIGSAFIRLLEQSKGLDQDIKEFVTSIKQAAAQAAG
jgi:tryptophan synthase alpha chain